jgi:hypothetical protein
LEEFRSCFETPEIAPLLKDGTDLDQLVVTLAAFWMGLCNMFLGGSPFIEISFPEDRVIDADKWNLDLVQAIGNGFDLIINGVLKKDGLGE